MDLVENGTDDEEYELLHKIVLDGMIKKYIAFFLSISAIDAENIN